MPTYYWFTCSNPDCKFEMYRYRNVKVCPKCRSPVIREEPVDFRVACYICGIRRDLEMFAHRNKNQQVVGWLFVCGGCAPNVADKDLIIELAEKITRMPRSRQHDALYGESEGE